jgi:beta-galactosidase
VGTDFVFPDSSNFADYKVIVVPPLYVASDELLAKLSSYVKGGGHIIMSFKSGFTDQNDTVRWTRAPGPLREAAGFSYQEFSNLKTPLPLKGDPYAAGGENKVSVWAEFLTPDTAKPLAYYDHPFFGRWPAVTRNAFGRGTLTYEGTYLSDALQRKVVAEVVKLARIDREQQVPAPVHARSGVDNAGRPMHYYLNYSASPQSFAYAHGAGKDLITGKSYAQTNTVTIPAWDLAIIEESK